MSPAEKSMAFTSTDKITDKTVAFLLVFKENKK